MKFLTQKWSTYFRTRHFVPVMLKAYTSAHPQTVFNVPLVAFFIIGIGGFACIVSGYISQKMGTKPTAFSALLLSCVCCLLSPFIFSSTSAVFFVGFLMFWGMVVIADSPLLSTMVAQNAIAEHRGTALTIVNCIGFSITIISIQCISLLTRLTDSNSIFVVLALGPIFGLMALSGKNRQPIG